MRGTEASVGSRAMFIGATSGLRETADDVEGIQVFY